MSNLYPNLMVDDVEETLTYYQAIGFSVVSKLSAEKPVWALIELDGIKLMFQARTSLVAEFPQLAE